MVSPRFVALASIPLIARLATLILPETWLEPYSFWTPESLNLRPGETVPTSSWRNMGYWETADTFPDAAEALAQKLLDFAEAPKGGAVLDVAHGNGDSLRLHLAQSPPPQYLYGLTSLWYEKEAADNLTASIPHPHTTVELFVSSASYRAGKDLDHPLNPMREYLGAKRPFSSEEAQEPSTSRPPPYNLVYVLDAIYHFKPAVPHFLSCVFNVLQPGKGVVAYTDILPPQNLNAVVGRFIIPSLLSIPARNTMGRPNTMEGYEDILKTIGYTGIKIEDWSGNVWQGFASDLDKRGHIWRAVAWVIRRAEKSGWKFIAVRAERPALQEE